MTNINLVALIDQFNCDTKCLKALKKIRWPNGIACTRCGDMKVHELPEKHKWRCTGCQYKFSVTSGTIMHDSHLPIRKWFLAIYLMVESKKGMSANQLKRILGINYRTAWFLCHRIREAMGNDPFDGPTLLGVVEVDETVVGGKVKGKGRAYKGNKTWVAGALQRGGSIRLERIPNVKRKTLHGFIGRAVKDEAEAIYTDELKSYLGIADHNTEHRTVNHSDEQWVVGEVHTNGIEGVWSLFKRSVIGTFHKMSAKHMDRYLEEMEWRFNNRDNKHIFQDTLDRIMNTGNLTYRELVSSPKGKAPRAA